MDTGRDIYTESRVVTEAVRRGGGLRARRGGAAMLALASVVAVLLLAAGLQPATAATGQRYRAWGSNGLGQLGDGTTTDAESPTAPSATANWKQISGGAIHTIALKDDGTVWAWGDNQEGQLGNGTTCDSPTTGANCGSTTPVQVSGLSGVTQVAAGMYHSLALKSDGTVWAWGFNGFGQLGNGTTTDSTNCPLRPTCGNVPTQVSGITDVTQVAAGFYHSLAIVGTGASSKAYAWGYNASGQLGDGTTINRSLPLNVLGEGGIGVLTDVAELGGGSQHSLALKNDAKALSWGALASKENPNQGQLCDHSFEKGSRFPGRAAAEIGVTDIAVAPGGFHSLFLKSNGTVTGCGNNQNGQLGDNTFDSSASPVKVRNSDNTANLTGVTAIAAGGFHSLAIQGTGTVLAWGSDGSGQVGNGPNELVGVDPESGEEVRVGNFELPQNTGVTNATAISAGYFHSLALVP
jgi:alpha-tubulin suppressor-like RCC1 family protein